LIRIELIKRGPLRITHYLPRQFLHLTTLMPTTGMTSDPSSARLHSRSGGRSKICGSCWVKCASQYQSRYASEYSASSSIFHLQSLVCVPNSPFAKPREAILTCRACSDSGKYLCHSTEPSLLLRQSAPFATELQAHSLVCRSGCGWFNSLLGSGFAQLEVTLSMGGTLSSWCQQCQGLLWTRRGNVH